MGMVGSETSLHDCRETGIMDHLAHHSKAFSSRCLKKSSQYCLVPNSCNGIHRLHGKCWVLCGKKWRQWSTLPINIIPHIQYFRSCIECGKVKSHALNYLLLTS